MLSCLAESHFWAAYAEHLSKVVSAVKSGVVSPSALAAASANASTPFLPDDITDAASSFTSAVAALAVLGIPIASSSSSTASSAAAAQPSATATGVTRSYAGAALTLTAQTPCIVYVKQTKPVAQVPSTPTGGSSGSSSTAAPQGSVLVADHLFDPQHSHVRDAESGEDVMVFVEAANLLAGYLYSRSVVITSTAYSTQQLDILIQVSCATLVVMSFGCSCYCCVFSTDISCSTTPKASRHCNGVCLSWSLVVRSALHCC